MLRFLVLLSCSGLFLACSRPPASPLAQGTDLPNNPLAPCPDTPNCVRESQIFDLDATSAFALALDALRSMKPAELKTDPAALRMQSVFRVVFFKDDFEIAIVAHSAKAVLHIRSASRVGRSDFGVNRRRVDRFYQRFDELLQAQE